MTELYSFLKKTTNHLERVSYRKAYGLSAVYVKDKAFILVTEQDRIAIKIENSEFLRKRKESITLDKLFLHEKVMENWYLVPSSYNKKKNRIIPLIDQSYEALFIQKRKKKPKKNKKVHELKKVEKVEVQKTMSLFSRSIAKFRSIFK